MRSLPVMSVALLLLALQSKLACADPVPCSCLQEKWVDFPGPYDLYFSLDHITSCDDEGEKVFGTASPRTQRCLRSAVITIAKSTKDQINAQQPYYQAMAWNSLE
jgi:hypothetical protein